MATSERPARYGVFHRRCERNPEEIDGVVATGELRGRPRGNFYAGRVPAVKAWRGPLPQGVVGFEFFTAIEPDMNSVPDWPEWSEGRPGVRVIERNELVAIDVIVTRKQYPER